ncbi:MAG: enoyl-CoA hydratase/isomerase family protein [Candidatus Omnitrophica bacterium]|nr:enoyl-CoA hydratase/isomerase family protein [Candidatus Omnitrophota bacterium]
MAGGELVKVKLEEAVAIVTISRPAANKVNVLTAKVMQELNEAIDEFAQDDNVKAIVITGEGPYTFIAGADIKEIAGIQTRDQAIELVKKGQSVLNKIENLDKPVICAVNAICLGGGMELAMACHMRIASDRAKFGQPEILLGIIPGFGGTQRLSRLCGLAKAREILLTGDQISAKDALDIGLVNQVVPEGRLLKESVGLAKKIALRPQAAVRLIQRAVREGAEKPLREGLSLEAELFGDVCQTSDMKEGVRAFLEKRQPKFQNQ